MSVSRLGGLLLATLVLAGCATTPEGVPPVETATAPAEAVRLVGTDTGCAYFCEPNVAVDTSGRIFVLGDDLAVSEDGGVTFTPTGLPPVPAPADFHGDSLIQASPYGALYHSSLLQG